MDDDTRKALLEDIRFALRKLDPWPPKDPAREGEKSREFARRVLENLELAGWSFTRKPPRQAHSTSDFMKD